MHTIAYAVHIDKSGAQKDVRNDAFYISDHNCTFLFSCREWLE